jgi:foldase protein PrsA
MIIEYLITWESIERRYEERSPLKWSYEYYQEKNMVRELEKVLLRPRVSVSDDEIKKFYQEHIEDFKHPDLYTVTILKAEKDLIDSIWQEVNRGGDISKLANRNDVKLSSLNNVDVERLPLEVREAVQQLNNNQVSSPLVMEDGEYVMVKLLGRTRNEARPLESVKEEIRKKLSPQKFQQVRDEYVEKVMNLSEIEINRKNWDKLIADLKK